MVRSAGNIIRGDSFLITILLVAVFGICGCGGGGPVYVHLRKSPTADFIALCKSDQSKKILYTFESKVPEEYSPFNTRLFVNLNESYASNLKYYMNNKFSVVDDAEDVKIEIVLDSAKAESRYDGQKTVGRATYSDGTKAIAYIEQVTISTEITVHIKVSEGGRPNERKIIGAAEYSGDIRQGPDITVGSFNLAIEKSMLLIDKFLEGVLMPVD